ncbi:MAG: hypothetical protein RL469_800 [Pseudomonadota bacterium]|jgi:hypothetical protein|nr:hypothetical protein [Gammaproteobacteria bacterium]
MRVFRLLSAAVVWMSLAACGDYSMPPKKIEADGSVYYACSGFIHSRKRSIEFTDANGERVALDGLKKLRLVSIPTKIAARMPSPLPDPRGMATDGVPFKDGWTYTWPDGAMAKLSGGKWLPVQELNPICASRKTK